MAKIKVLGDLKFEFDVKYGLKEDLIIETTKINYNGSEIVIGKGEIEKIDRKSLSFVGDRIEYFLKKNKNIVVDLDSEVFREMYNKKISPVYEIIHLTYVFKSEERNKIIDIPHRREKINEVKKVKHLREIAENKTFILGKKGMELYLDILKEYEELKNREDICFIS